MLTLRENKTAAKAKRRTTKLGEIALGSESLAYLFLKLGEKEPEERERLRRIATEISKDRGLRESLVTYQAKSPEAVQSARELADAVAFHKENPGWWETKVEGRLQGLANAARGYLSDEEKVAEFDAMIGAWKGVYGFSKGLLLAIPDLAELAVKLTFDKKTQEAAGKLNFAILSTYAKLQYGGIERQREAIEEIVDFGKAIWASVVNEFSTEWDSAVKEGKESEVVSKWIVRGALEISLLALAEAKGARAAKQALVVAQNVEKGEVANEVALSTVEVVKNSWLKTTTKIVRRDRRGGPLVTVWKEAQSSPISVASGRWETNAIEGAVQNIERSKLRWNLRRSGDFTIGAFPGRSGGAIKVWSHRIEGKVLNDISKANGMEPSWVDFERVFEWETKQSYLAFRVHKDINDAKGRWLLPFDPRLRFSKEELKEGLALTRSIAEIKKISVIEIPAGMQLRFGRAGANRCGKGGMYQIHILENLEGKSFVKTEDWLD